jgi:L-threonylcarbamoyladenylate synthase
MQIAEISTYDPQEHAEAIGHAAELLRSGGLVVFPTETVYGIGASAVSDRGLEALRAFKGRSDVQPFTIHVPSSEAALRYVDTSQAMVRRLVCKAFPGPVTLVFEVSEPMIESLAGELGLAEDACRRLYHQGTIGLRCPDHPLTQAILASVGEPVIASSANRRGEAPPHDAREAAQAVGEAAGLIVDGGPCRYTQASTIVRIGKDDGGPVIRVERAGVYEERYIRQLMSWTLTFVCSGNTCRSPMAQGIAKQILAQERGTPVSGLEAEGIQVHSAGVYATAGMPASPEAIHEMDRMGIDLSRHRSQPLTPELIQRSDVICCMTRAHHEAVIRMDASAAGKTHLVHPGSDIEDPIGLGEASYRRCVEALGSQIKLRLQEHPI